MPRGIEENHETTGLFRDSNRIPPDNLGKVKGKFVPVLN